MKNFRIEKMKNLSLAALLMAGAAFTACSSSEENIIEQPVNPTEPQVYTLVIKASKGGATTRALKTGDDGIDAYWIGGEDGEKIDVLQKGVKIGTATAAASDDENTTITATLTSAPDKTDDLIFYLCGSNWDYTGQVGLLTGTGSISEKYDYVTAVLYGNSYNVDNNNYKVTPKESYTVLNFDDGITNQAIIKFTLQDKGNSNAAISPSALTVSDGNSTVELINIPAATYTANGASNVLYVAFPASGMAKTITLTAAVGDDYYAYTTSSAKTFVNGQYYEITVKMTKNENARPLTLEAIEDGTIRVEFDNDLTLPKPITYTKNGVAGEPITATTEIPVSANDKVCLYSKNSYLGYYTEDGGMRKDYNINITTSKRCYIYGNVMSLLDDSGSGFVNDKVIADNTADKHTSFFRLFERADALENHPSKSILLPATTLAVQCYSEMFYACRSLTTAPELPAETLASRCYANMFQYCSSLTTAPELSATTLADNCCNGMFRNCTSLTTAPVLRAETLVTSCYSNMFNGCTSLSYVKCLATTFDNGWYHLNNWLNDVSATGTFVRASGATWAVAGTNGIPSGWTVQNAE